MVYVCLISSSTATILPRVSQPSSFLSWQGEGRTTEDRGQRIAVRPARPTVSVYFVYFVVQFLRPLRSLRLPSRCPSTRPITSPQPPNARLYPAQRDAISRPFLVLQSHAPLYFFPHQSYQPSPAFLQMDSREWPQEFSVAFSVAFSVYFSGNLSAHCPPYWLQP